MVHKGIDQNEKVLTDIRIKQSEIHELAVRLQEANSELLSLIEELKVDSSASPSEIKHHLQAMVKSYLDQLPQHDSGAGANVNANSTEADSDTQIAVTEAAQNDDELDQLRTEDAASQSKDQWPDFDAVEDQLEKTFNVAADNEDEAEQEKNAFDIDAGSRPSSDSTPSSTDDGWPDFENMENDFGKAFNANSGADGEDLWPGFDNTGSQVERIEEQDQFMQPVSANRIEDAITSSENENQTGNERPAESTSNAPSRQILGLITSTTSNQG